IRSKLFVAVGIFFNMSWRFGAALGVILRSVWYFLVEYYLIARRFGATGVSFANFNKNWSESLSTRLLWRRILEFRLD
ncbi:MAG: hypothetical protein ACKO96_25515, partial [Flammeovirgaceae bacterium]